MSMKRLALLATAIAGGLAFATPASAQAQNTLTIVREVDSDRYDPHRSTARAPPRCCSCSPTRWCRSTMT